MYARRGKRIVDLVVAGFLLVLLSPVMLVVAGLVRWRLGSPVLFRQVRPGRDGRLFTILKFRTMRETTRDAARGGVPLPDEERMTTLGRRLRAASLDEIPELWNVVRGDMSLVGPRPLLVEYLSQYSPRQARRHEVRPGITGHAQVSGRNTLPWAERFDLDVWYVDNVSFRVDARILVRTVLAVLRSDGVQVPSTANREAIADPSGPES